ncbi:MAG: gliding motility-associated protein GldE [Flavobacteriaceae bacterium]|nr:gliding motility-associated protein GldE [Candidatus Arcticimaribacter sp.]MDB4067185.1 gliding motility-associated protein GldE [Flavobacteriaceae bacterium]MDB4151957.1 gliding motility-associated protein GldE [Flavobacteriaceae bacterium]MDG1058689.1 gliding motility-associated protein GldE [Flavobacteriaceae bacterium]MDG1090396.1 gliding motility-associated protein GldE [Flavobacteriaceae bacterium]
MDPEPLSIYFLSLAFEPIIGLKIILLAFLLLGSALISGAEVAFFSLTPSLIEEQKEKYPKKIQKIESLLQKPKRLLATILVANNFINIAVVLLFASLGELLFGGISNELIRLSIEIGVITFVILLFGEILPKIYANKNSMLFSRFMVGAVYALDRKILFFITIPMSKITLFLERNFGQQSNSFSVDTLSQALEFTEQKDTTKQEDQILQGIINFGTTDTKQVMCPRIDVFALEKEMSFEEILPLIIEKGFSRIPVYNDKMDQIDGILYVKDLMPNINSPGFKWQELLREPYYVPENKKLDDLLNEFKVKKMHMAVVVDEYGGTSGIVTLEDLIEEIVGDIADEFDEEELEYSKIDEKNFVVDAKVGLKDFYKIIQIEEVEAFEKAKGEAETLAGFILEIAQQLPVFGQRIVFEKIIFTIELVDKKRIKQIKVTLP